MLCTALLLLTLIENVVGPHLLPCFGTCKDCTSLGNKILDTVNMVTITNSANWDYSVFPWTIKVFPVLNTHVDPPVALFGWFFLKLELDQRYLATHVARIIAVQAQSALGRISGAGHFLYPPDGFSDGNSCQATVTGHETSPFKPSSENVLPCLTTRNPNHLPTSGFGFGALHQAPYAHDLTMLHRLDFPPCPAFDDSKPLTYKAYIIKPGTTQGMLPLVPEIFVKEWAYGASDPAPPKGKMKCDSSPSLDLSQSHSTINWIASVTQYDRRERFDSPGLHLNCGFGLELYYGRCSDAPRGQVLDEHTCRDTNNYYNALPEHGEVTKAEFHKCSTCPRIEEQLKNFTQTFGYPADSITGREIWALRQGHGVAMTIVTFFLLPVSSFISRYFKETYMAEKIVHLHVWYAVHVHLSMTSALFLFAGLVPQIWSRSFLGFSMQREGQAHVMVGYVSVGLFLIVFLSNGFRCVAPSCKFHTVFCHCFLGTMCYIFCVAAMLISCWIPGSPSGTYDIVKTYFGFRPGNVILATVIIRIVVDIIFCILMMVNLRSADKTRGKGKRVYACLVPIPFCSVHHTQDIPGGTKRKFMFGVYIVISLILTILVSAFITFSSSTGRSYGPMTETHSTTGGFYDLVFFD